MKKKCILLIIIIFISIFALNINSVIYGFEEVENVKDLTDNELEEELKKMITEMTHSRCNGGG